MLYRAAMAIRYGSKPHGTTGDNDASEEYQPRHSERADRDVNTLTSSIQKARLTTTREPPRLIDTKAIAHDTKAQRLLDLVNSNDRSNNTRGSTNRADAAAHEEQEEQNDEIRVRVERTIEVPSTLVGLLLSKKPKTKVTILNQMQHMTHTIISKIINPDTLDPSCEGYEAALTNRRRDAENQDSDGENSGDDSRSDGDAAAQIV